MELDRLLINNKDNESFKARPGQIEFIMFGRVVVGLLAPSGALVVIMVYYVSAAATFSDLSIQAFL